MTSSDDAFLRCDTCGNQVLAPLLLAGDLRTAMPGEFSYSKCMRCGLVQLSPLPTLEQLEAAYPEWLWQDELARGRISPSRVHHALAQLARHGKTAGTMLDVGCGPGTMLAGATLAGWQARGIESSRAQVKYCMSIGLNAEYVPDFPSHSDSNLYDAVVFNHVLEHVSSPKAYLEKAIHLLKPDGLLFVAVPNFDSLSRQLFGRYWMHLDAPRHLFQFTPHTLRDAIQNAGATVVDLAKGDRDDNATGARDSLRRWLVYGALRRPARATRAPEMGRGRTTEAERRSPARLAYRAYGQLMAAVGEAFRKADTIIAIARRA